MNGASVISFERIKQQKQARFNPLRNLTPDALVRQMDAFATGNLRDFALTMEAMERRDDTLKSVAPKRKGAVARRAYEILTVSDLDEAQKVEAERHKEALQHFWGNISATSAVDRNEEGGFSLLVRQMMNAVGFKYAVHEIIWKPAMDGLTAQFNYVPLWFFENQTGQLRFLQSDYAYEGVALEPGAWLVTVGDGIMEACAVAYMFKHLPLKDWLIFSQDFGRPAIEGITESAKGSDDWESMVEAVAAFSSDLRTVHSRSGEIKVTPVNNPGQAPFETLVERMDRAMARLWRGADLSTISAGQGQGQGASLQGDETEAMEMDDAAFISETCWKVDKLVISYTFGEGTKPLAYLKVIVPEKQDIDGDLKIDAFLRDSGVPVGVKATMERYGRPVPDPDEALLQKPGLAPIIPLQDPAANERQGARQRASEVSEKLLQSAAERLGKAVADDLQPLRNRLERILEIDDPEILRTKLRALLEELPRLARNVLADPSSADALTEAMSAALFNGAAQGMTGRRNQS